MNRREFLKSVSAVVIAVSIPEVVIGAVRAVDFPASRKVVKLQLREVEIVEWRGIGKHRAATVRALVPFRDDCCYSLCTMSEKLLESPIGIDLLIKDLMTCAKIAFKRDKDIDIKFEGYRLSSTIKDVSKRRKT